MFSDRKLPPHQHQWTVFVYRLALCGGLVLLGLAGLHFYSISSGISVYGFIDTPTFITQAIYFRDEGELYTNPLRAGGPLDEMGPTSPWFKFPPAYLLAYMPWLPPEQWYELGWSDALGADVLRSLLIHLWQLHVVRYLLCLAACLWVLRPQQSTAFLIHGAIMGLLFTPFFESLYGLIFDNLLLSIIVAMLCLSKTRWNTVSGFLVGIAAMLKLYPAVLCLWLLACCRRRAALWLLLACASLLLLSLLVFGIEPHRFYYFNLLPLLLNETSLTEPGNFSLGRFFVLLMDNDKQAMQVFAIFKNILLLLSAFVLWQSRPASNRPDANAAIKLSLAVSMLLLYLPNYWSNYQLVLLVPILTLLANAYNKGYLWRTQGAVSTLCWLLMLFTVDSGGVYTPLSLGKLQPLASHIVSCRFAVPLLLWGLCMAVTMHTIRAAPRVNTP